MSRMKSMMKGAVLSALMGATAAPAMADGHDHTVYVFTHGYFPSTLYASYGDVVRFENLTGRWMHVNGSFSGWISVGGSKDVTLGTNGSGFNLNSPYLWRASYSNTNGGKIEFGTAPRQ